MHPAHAVPGGRTYAHPSVGDYIRSQIPQDVKVNIDLRPTVLLEMRFTPRKNERGVAHLEAADKPRWRAFCERVFRLSKKGEPYNVRASFEHDPGIRTAGANRLLWGTYRWILAGLRENFLARRMETGRTYTEAELTCPFDDEDDLHSAMKNLILGQRVVVIDGEEMKLEPSTKKLDRDQFSFFYEMVCKWANDHSVSVPSPEEMFG